MGWKFTVTTIGSVSLLSLLTSLDHLLPAFTLPSLMGAVTGGLIAGLGLSILFMNGASLGGANILALFAQRKFGWDPGKVNFHLISSSCCRACIQLDFQKEFSLLCPLRLQGLSSAISNKKLLYTINRHPLLPHSL